MEPQKKEDGVTFATEVPVHGREYFFSNHMVKVYQTPNFFVQSSDFIKTAEQGCFVVHIYEKKSTKRKTATKDKEIDKLDLNYKLKQLKRMRYCEDSL